MSECKVITKLVNKSYIPISVWT